MSKTSGAYEMPLYLHWDGPMHLRVRSNGSGATSPGFYITTDYVDGC